MPFSSNEIMKAITALSAQLNTLTQEVSAIKKSVEADKVKYDLMEMTANELKKFKKIGSAELERRERSGLLKPCRKYKDSAGRTHRRYRLSDVLESEEKAKREKEQKKAAIEEKKASACAISSRDLFLNARRKIVGL